MHKHVYIFILLHYISEKNMFIQRDKLGCIMGDICDLTVQCTVDHWFGLFIAKLVDKCITYTMYLKYTETIQLDYFMKNICTQK